MFTQRFAVASAAALALLSGCTAAFFRTPILDLIGPTTAVAIPSPDAVINAGQTILLDGSESRLFLGSGNSLGASAAGFTFAWTVTTTPTGAAPPTLAGTNSSQPTFTAFTPGRYVVTLTVTDGTNTGSGTITIDVI